MAYFVPALCLVDPLPAPAIAPGPEGAQRTGRSVVVDPFLVRAANDPVHHRDRAHAKPVHVGQDLLRHYAQVAHQRLFSRTILDPADPARFLPLGGAALRKVGETFHCRPSSVTTVTVFLL